MFAGSFAVSTPPLPLSTRFGGLNYRSWSLALGTPAATVKMYGAGSPTPLAPSSIGNFGGGASHENRQPFLPLNYIIALQGIFPSQN
jgi:microcystin-dependent protein